MAADGDLQARLPAPVWAVPLALLVVAVAPWWPYGFYTLLRLMVCGASVYTAYALLSAGQRSWLGWLFVGLAILYNPVFRVHFDRDTWSVLNLVSAFPFAVLGWTLRRPAA
ncbi:MAG: hypothetical protein JNL41_07115 [Phenylobacterium sp.]|uniref:DUF6804 family protein n=1 Tax=Phenylobacterium sp. TaxID=1871053 RepID=UPI001A3ED1D7|nr:DUF6804 family protein [Phenylobacterium sp.]MBL8554031.1 hypothetical protein [Phenylobacterium sp.]